MGREKTKRFAAMFNLNWRNQCELMVGGGGGGGGREGEMM